MKKPSTKLTDQKEIEDRFDEMLRKANNEGPRAPTEGEIKELRAFMREHEGEKLWQRVASPGQAAIDYLLQMRIAGPGMSEVWRLQVDDMKKEFGFEEAPRVEKFLIQHIILCWLQLNVIELSYAQLLKEGSTLPRGAFWDRRVSMAQRRFTRACESLERLRALTAAARYAKARAEAAEGPKAEERTGPRALSA